METKRVRIRIEDIRQTEATLSAEKAGDWLKKAGELIRQGEVVAFPTETVYGLGANAMDSAACKKIYAVKGRPSDNPLIVHIASYEEVKDIVRVWPGAAEICARKFWPGPLTIVLPKKESIPDIVSGGLDTVAVRMPSHPVALALIKAAGCPLAAPSANLSGKPSPTNADHVWQDLNGKIPMLIDAGASAVGLESTVLDLTGETPVILRPGGITREQLEDVLGKVDLDRGVSGANDTVRDKGSVSNQEDALIKPRSPGMKYRHYAPEGEVVLFGGTISERIGIVSDFLRNKKDGTKTALLCFKETALALSENVLCEADSLFILGSQDEPEAAASRLFEGLRYCDKQRTDVILAEEVPEEGIGLAFMNRLRKAAGKKSMRDPAIMLSRPDRD